MNLSEQDIRAIVRDEIRSMLGGNATQHIEYLPTNKAVGKLGFSSPQSLRKAIENNTFRLGKEVQDRREPNSKYANYYFNIPACIKRLNTSPDKRSVK